MNTTARAVDPKIAALLAKYHTEERPRAHVFREFPSTENDEFLVRFMGIEITDGQGSELPSYTFLYEALFSSFGVNVSIAYDEIGNDTFEEAGYDVQISAGGDSVMLATTARAIACVVKLHEEAGFNLLDATE